MANKIDILQNKKIRSLFYLVATLGAATSIFVFFENRKYRTIPHETVLEDMESLRDEKLIIIKQSGQLKNQSSTLKIIFTYRVL